MTDTFLSPMGDYSAVATFCGVTDGTRTDFARAVDTAARAVRAKCGPVLLEDGLAHSSWSACYLLALPFRAASLASITDVSGAVLSLAEFHVPPHHLGGHGGQVVLRRDGGSIPACTVVYTSGWAHGEVPPELVGAGFEIARHLWRTQLGSQRTGDEQGSAWLWPKQAEALVADWALPPLGFA